MHDDSWFEEQDIKPLRITYEALSADSAGTLMQVCNSLGVEVTDAASIRPGVAKLADVTNEEWMRRYRQDAAQLSDTATQKQ